MKLAKLNPYIEEHIEHLESVKPKWTLFGFAKVELDRRTSDAVREIITELENQIDVLKNYFDMIERDLEILQLSDHERMMGESAQYTLHHMVASFECVTHDAIYHGRPQSFTYSTPRVPRIRNRRETDVNVTVKWKDVLRLIKTARRALQIDLPPFCKRY